MPDIKTTITEVITGLGMTEHTQLGTALQEALVTNPVGNVTPEIWEEIWTTHKSGKCKDEFNKAWENGKAFLESEYGLRGRPPAQIEWKGLIKSPSYDLTPVDIRVDQVYHISCKYNSSILHNTSPINLFDNCLAEQKTKNLDWYAMVAPTEYLNFYKECAEYLGPAAFPEGVEHLTRQQRDLLATGLRDTDQWPISLMESYRALCREVAQVSAAWWMEKIEQQITPDEMYWRIVRLNSFPYFILGKHEKKPVRSLIMTPSDWRNHYEMVEFIVIPDMQAGQPLVLWQATVKDKRTNLNHIVEGYIQIRWGHGKFSGQPAVKIYLTTPLTKVKGYVPLT